jgi:ADP-ribose pyrophosphatase
VSRFEVLDAEVIHRSPVFEVVRASVRFPDGNVADRSLIRHPGAVALIALDDEGRWLLVRQYRLAVAQELLEVPAGTLDPGETPETTAQRELREETGFAADSLERLGGTWMVPGYCNEYIHYFLATGLRFDPLDQDEDEHLSAPVPMTYDEVAEAVDEGRIQDAKTVAALWLYDRYRRRHHVAGDVT